MQDFTTKGLGATDAMTTRITIASDSAEPTNPSTVSFTFNQGIVTNASTSVPVPLSSTPTAYQSVVLIPGKAPQVANAGTVYIGPQSVTGTQPLPIAVGQPYPIEAPQGKKIDLSLIYMAVTVSGDGLNYLFMN